MPLQSAIWQPAALLNVLTVRLLRRERGDSERKARHYRSRLRRGGGCLLALVVLAVKPIEAGARGRGRALMLDAFNCTYVVIARSGQPRCAAEHLLLYTIAGSARRSPLRQGKAKEEKHGELQRQGEDRQRRGAPVTHCRRGDYAPQSLHSFLNPDVEERLKLSRE